MSISNNTPPIPLSAQVKQAVDNYLKQLDGYDATGLHAMVLAEVEKPLLKRINIWYLLILLVLLIILIIIIIIKLRKIKGYKQKLRGEM